MNDRQQVALTNPLNDPCRRAPRRLANASRLYVCEREAIALLAGVGGDTEWWIYNRSAAIGHLRVPVTEIEFDQCPAGIAIADAGPSGERRPRTYPKGRGKRSGAS